MGAEFVWRRAMSRLRQTIGTLGMEFVGEMLGREDLTNSSSPEVALTDSETIRLAEQLGVVSSTGALKLRHAFEILAHYVAGEAGDEALPFPDALGIVHNCVKFALGSEDVQVAVNFSNFRSSLLSRTLTSSEPEIEQLAGSPPFFVSTAIRALLAAVRTEKGARQQHALSNIVVVLPAVWEHLPEEDRWAIGEAYAEASAAGETTVVADIKRALLKVRGFDYVPENLRSQTYRRLAQEVVRVHLAWGNFAAEVKPTKDLASLGTVIPKPAVPETVRAFLLVYLGNRYGCSFSAAAVAEEQLRAISTTTWDYYLRVILPADEYVLQALQLEKPAKRLSTLTSISQMPLEVDTLPPAVGRIIVSAREARSADVERNARALYRQFKGPSS